MRTHGIADSIKEQIAKAIVRESHPGYMRSYMGESYVVDTDGDQVFDAVMFKEAAAQWNPWTDSATALEVQALYEHCAGDVDFSPISEDGEDMTDAAELLALEYMPEYYPPFDVNEDDPDIEDDPETLAQQERDAQVLQWEHESRVEQDRRLAEFERSLNQE